MDRGWVRNRCGPNQRIRHGYDRVFPDKPPVEAGDACTAVTKGMGINSF